MVEAERMMGGRVSLKRDGWNPSGMRMSAFEAALVESEVMEVLSI